jgi:anthranilate synthase component 1
MEYAQFKELAAHFNRIPVFIKVTADLLTPVLAYLKLRDKTNHCFLLESVEGIGRLARYSFIGVNPSKIIMNKGMKITIKENGKEITCHKNLFHYLKELMAQVREPKLEDLPIFTGGIVGYLGYENISLVEDVIDFAQKNHFDSPDSIFGLYDTIIAFDHYKHQIILITNVSIEEDSDTKKIFKLAKEDLVKRWIQLLQPIEFKSDFQFSPDEILNGQNEKFLRNVLAGKQNIQEGDIFQIVLSRRFQAVYSGDLLNVYRALRIINPSPYMYFMELGGDFTIIGTSPEDLLNVKDRRAVILPIAGTRKRGQSLEEDLNLEKDLLNDPKELAEHVMLVDLARNDLGRISKYETVRVVENMAVHRYSHVMHLVSRVEGILDDDKDCIDALMAAFPAGTLTGAPKIRAIQLIESYESIRRNVYGGAIGYIDFNGNLDMCIAIRTLFAKGNKIYWQAGAGIVADSQPQRELQEIENKSAVLLNALKYAEVIDEDTSY